MLILSYLRTGADWTELWSSNADWFGLGLLPNGFGPDWIPWNESVSYSASDHTLQKLYNRAPATVFEGVMKLSEYDKIIGIYKMYISDFLYRWP